MYTKEETSRIKQSFWTSFGQYMKPVPAASGEKVNWVNYKTGAPHIYFRMKAEKNFASVAIELTHPSPEGQQQRFAQFEQLKTLLHEILGEEWLWERSVTDAYGHPVSRISVTKQGLNVMDKSCWPEIISFLKPRMMALDVFWDQVRYGFE